MTNLRYFVAIALVLGLVSGARAQEVQITVTGNACPASPDITCLNTPADQVPFTATFDLNTSSAQLTPYFLQTQGDNYLVHMDGSDIGYSNFTGSINGQSVGPPSAGSMGLFMVAESINASQGTGTYEFFLGDFNFHSGFPLLTQNQFQALGNPLFTLLTSPGVGLFGGPDGGGMDGYNFTNYSATISVVSVPEPGVLVLCLPGIAGLWLARRRPGWSALP